MQVVDVITRGATAPIRLGLTLGSAGLSIARTVLDEARHAVAGEGSSRSSGESPFTPSGDDPSHAAGWTRPHPPRVWSPAPAIRRRLAGRASVESPPMASLDIAERGAEDGAGAEVHVDPPWDGYDALTAADVRDRLTAADAALATAVALYEGANRGRVSVVRAAERRLAALAG